ncbi:ABC transporter transmembrane domain-containing protein [Paenibacillus sp. FSL F4-0125]|uniref:ABC transporter transmembrane domain-containing protein n=1 Tax=Paenibacillus sp. FSL F4-0125 TaxID=2954730 RepID=UPI0030FBDAAD
MRTIWRYFSSYKTLSTVFLLGLFIEVAYAVAAPLSLQYLVDLAFTPRDVQVFFIILGILVMGGSLSIAAGLGGDYALSKLSGRVVQRLRSQLFNHIQKQTFPFFQRYRVGDLVTRFSSDMSSIEKIIYSSVPYSLKEGLSTLLGLIVLFSIQWKLAFAMLLGSVLMFVGPKLLQGRAEAANTRYKEAQEQFANTMDEAVKGHQTIRALHQQNRFRQRAEKQISQLFTFGLKVDVTGSLMERLPLTALLILNGTMIGFGGYLIFQGEMSVGGFIAFFTLFMSVGQSGANLSFIIPDIIESSISIKRISELFDYQPDVPEAASPIALGPFEQEIQMNKVTFGYTEETNQLTEITLSITAGSFAAFVGPSGSGKSTALQLLSRFYDPKSGYVTIDHTDLRLVSEASLREQVGIVSQNTYLFEASVRDNLLLDNREATEEELFEAAQLARIHETIVSWPEGYDTLIHSEGSSLSGGQRQRISITRALLRNPKILLLDEITSALDPSTEADINQSIEQLRKQKTIISVTHRLSSIVDADVIFVFKDGKILDTGTHQELMQREGLYLEMWEKQHGFRLSPDGLHATIDVNRLAKFPFFAGVEFSELESIAKLFSSETCKEGDTIVQEGDHGDKFYIIIRGRFEILKQISGAENHRVAVLEDGDHFGEIALLADVLRTASVQALEPSLLLSLRREAFLELTTRYPHILETVEQTLVNRI